MLMSSTNETSVLSSFSAISMVMAENPGLSTRRTSTSSSSIRYPEMVMRPDLMSSSATSWSGREASASRTAGRSCRALRPSALRFGWSSTLWKRSRSSSMEIFSTLSSSERSSCISARSGPPTTHPSAQGNRCLRFASTRILRPISAS